MDIPCAVVVVVVTLTVGVSSLQTNMNQTEAQAFLDMYNTEAQQVFSANARLSWAYSTNITAENQENSVRLSPRKSALQCVFVDI